MCWLRLILYNYWLWNWLLSGFINLKNIIFTKPLLLQYWLLRSIKTHINLSKKNYAFCNCIFEWVFFWVLFFIANVRYFQLYHGENKLHFDIYTWTHYPDPSQPVYVTLSWIFTVLGHWSNSWRVDMSLHSDTLSWFLANQSLLHLNAARLAEKQQIPIL